MRELERLLDSLDLSVALSADLAGPAAVEQTAEWAADARRRLGYLGDTVVLGVAGGSGSGKSALVNALVGREVAGTGPVRPTTGDPLVALPSAPEPGIVELLDALGLHRRVVHDIDDRLVLVDLPDVDSASAEHRRIVERLARRLDGLVWVLDPEKYNDQSIHVGLLDSMVRLQRHVLLVLNQADRLAPADLKEVVDDAWKRLLADGFDDPKILPTAAAPRHGEPYGIDELREAITAMVQRKGTAIDKLIAEVGAARETLSVETGVRPGSSVGFDKTWASNREQLVEALRLHLGLPEFEQAVGEVGATKAVGTLRGAFTAWRSGSEVPAPRVDLPTGGWTELSLPLNRMVAELGERGEALGAVRLDEFGGEWAERQVREVAGEVVSSLPPPPVPEVPSWVKPATYVKYGLGIVAILAVLITFFAQSTLQAGRWPVLLLLAAACLGGAMVLDMAGQRAGREAGQVAAAGYVADITARLERGVDHRIATPLRDALRPRAQLAGSLTELGLAAAALAERRAVNAGAGSPPESDLVPPAPASS